MAFDFSGALQASRRLSKQNLELSALNAALGNYRSRVSGAWSGEDAAVIDQAIERLSAKIRRAQGEISGVCKLINDGAAALKVKEETERAEAELRKRAAAGK